MFPLRVRDLPLFPPADTGDVHRSAESRVSARLFLSHFRAVFHSDKILAAQGSYQHCVTLRSLQCRERTPRYVPYCVRNVTPHSVPDLTLGIRRVARPFGWQPAR